MTLTIRQFERHFQKRVIARAKEKVAAYLEKNAQQPVKPAVPKPAASSQLGGRSRQLAELVKQQQ